LFAFIAKSRGLRADRTFTLRPTLDGLSTIVVSHETQVGPLPWVGRWYLARRLRAVNQVMFADLARAASSLLCSSAPGQGDKPKALRR
jgi:hypothetical protein